MLKKLILVLAAVSIVTCDVYLHTPRGSNNRLRESSRDRKNNNRLFDSQNNRRGGYNVGDEDFMKYYAGSTLMVEWTNQHECGQENSKCDIIIQMMCGRDLQDGVNRENPVDKQYRNKGIHESEDYYNLCKKTNRNKGLFTADQELKKNDARSTRQNPNGARSGNECPEERDYYPYWRPTPWIDLAILTHDDGKCDTLKNNSENVVGRFYCNVPNNNQQRPITKSECEGISGATWVQAEPHGYDEPYCGKPPKSRDNHLGNGLNAQPNTYALTFPNKVCAGRDKAVLRIRYNISTGDYPEDADFEDNGDSKNIIKYQNLGFGSENEATGRGYKFKNNPEVKPFEGTGKKMNLGLAINTAQFGRVFQDRSHTFQILPKSGFCETIHNLNVRGKRGNIVQVYPAVEYDFVPNTLEATVNDCIHIQWNGADTNPSNNDGEGRARLDRSNIVMLAGSIYDEEQGEAETRTVYGKLGRSYPAHIDDSKFLGLEKIDRQNLAVANAELNNWQTFQPQLDDVPSYFDLGLKSMATAGCYNYMCTRNNNFSNRSQKGKICVNEATSKDSSTKSNKKKEVEKNKKSRKRTYHDKIEEMINVISKLEKY